MRGIFLNTATSASETINNNTVTVNSGATTSSLTAIDNAAGSTAASNTVAINNNTIQNSTYSTATSGSFTGISNSASAATVNINGNIVTGNNIAGTGTNAMILSSATLPTLTINNNTITINNRTGATGSQRGISFGSPTSGTISGNTVDGMSYTVAGSTGNIDGIFGLSSSVNMTITNNIVRNLSTPTTGTINGIRENGITGTKTIQNNQVNNFSTTAGGAGGATLNGVFFTVGNIEVSSNTINTLNSTGTTGGTGGVINGVNISGGTTNNIFKNKIYDLSSTSTNPVVAGITVSSGTTNTIYNNLVGDLRATAANAANPLIGLNITGGTTANVYFNTVYLTGASTGALFGSSAISASTTPALTLRNNIFSNASTVTGAGLAVAYRRSSVTLTTYQSASNNNDFNASTIYTDGTTPQTTIAAYKTLVSPRDSASFNETPNFLSTTGSSANFLHISAATATQLESGSATISGITDDFDGQTRNVTTPDIGADEFTGIGLDLSAPNITYTNLANTASTANRVLTATITDATGVASGGLAPRIYYRKNGGAYFSSQCTGTSPTYTCTIVVANMGGVVATDVIGYFVVAQDTVGNLGSNPGGATGTDVNNITTPPTPNTYTIVPSISGTKTVGTGGDYTTLTAAIAAVNGAEITGAVTLSLTNALYDTATGGEAFPLTLNANNGSNATNTVTIKPAAGVTSAITGSSASCVIGFNGADFMTIDGSNTVGGTTRNLTVTNTNAGLTSAVVCIQNTAALDGATNNVVKNTNIVGNTNITTLFGVFSGGTAISTASVGTGNNTNTIQNNNLSKTQFGIYSQGASAGAKNTGNIITKNLINTASPNNVQKGGIQIGFENNVTISDNNIGGIVTSQDCWGITLGVSSWAGTLVTGNEVTNATVTRNTIGLVQNNGTNSVAGIIVAPATSGTTLIANNMISGVTGNSTPGDLTTGIFVNGGTGSITNIYNNSVSMTGDRGTGTTASSLALAIGGANPVVNVINNALFNTQTTASTGRSYAIGLGYGVAGSANFTNLTSNYNDLFTSGANAGFSTITNLNPTVTELTSLAAWQNAATGTGKDTPNSISVDPLFTSLTDLHISGAPLQDAGTTIAAVTDDIDGQSRPQGAAYDIGADESLAAPGVLQLSAATYGGNEGTTLVATVNRVLGSAGIVGATYTLTDGSAIGGAACGVGVDYVNPGPTALSFGNAVTSQPINVTLCTDLVIDPADTFTITLSLPTGGASLGSPTVAIATITDVPPPFNGTFTVGSGGNYPSLTNAGGIFEAINASGATGNITINITSDLTAENGTVALNEVAGGFTVLIKPSGAARSISGTSATNIIKLSGVDGVTIDGSLSGGTDRSLTINITGNGAAIWNGTNATSGANSNTFKNLNIAGATPFTSQGILSSSGTTLGSAAEFAQSNNTIQNNSIIRVQNAVFTVGNATTLDQNLMVTGNTFGSATAADKLGFRGAIVQNAQNFTVTRNTISGISSTTASSSTMSGIQIGGVINGGSVTRNDIKDIRQNNTAGWGSNGIYLISSSTAANVLVSNNFVSDIASQGFAGAGSGDNGYGIMIDTGAGYNIYHNTVVMNTNQVAVGSVTAALNIAAAVTTAAGIDVRDNILANIQTIGTQYSVYDASTAGNAIFANINYNDYYTIENVGFLTSARVTLANWQTATGKDANSISIDPTFVSATDFHIQTGSPAINAGTMVAGVTVDFDGQTRDAMPDIGADEIIAAAVNLSVSSNTGSEAAATVITVTATASSPVVGNQTVVLTVTGTNITAGDYTLSPPTITILSGQTTGTATFTVVDDVLVEGLETARITESMPSAGITLGATTFQDIVITDNDVAPQPGTFQFNPATFTVGEGGGNASLTVTRTDGSDGAVAVAYSLSNGTATGGATCTGTADFNNTGGTINFAATQTSQTISVPICDDSIFESSENFTATINSADNGGTIGTPATATVTITENDTAPTLQFNSATYSNADDFAANRVKSDELAPSVATITVTRTGASGDAVSVNYATGSGSATGGAACAAGSGVDYVSTNGTLNFAAGVTMQTFNVTVCTDNLFEGSETVNLALSTPTAPAVLGTPNTAVLTLTDNETIPTLQFSSATYTNADDIAVLGITTEEFAPSVATITVTRTGATDNAVSVNYATMGGTATGGASCTTGVDYISTSGTLNFAFGDLSKTFNITVCTDALFEGDETVGLVLTNPVGGALGTPNSATLTITDNEVQPAVQFNSATYTVGEGGGSATVTVTRTGATDNVVSVNYATSNGTATGGAACAAGTDYDSTSGTLNFAAGDTSKTFTVAICEDVLAEGDETVNLTLTSPTGGVLGTPNTAVLTITDNEGQPSLQFSAATASVGEGGGTAVLSVTRSGASGNAVSVNYATTGGTATSGATCAAGVDFIAASGTLNFGSGVTSQPLNVTICDDGVFENNESFTATLSNAGGGAIVGNPSVNTVTINDNDFAPNYTINTVSQNEGNSGMSNFVFTVTKNGASEVNTTVGYQTADGSATVADNDYAAASGVLTFLPADTSKTVTVVVNGDTVVEPNETFSVNLGGGFMRSIPSGTGTIINDDAAAAPTVSLSVTANSGTEAGTTAITVSAVLTGGTVATAQTVTLGTSGTATLGSDYTLSGGNLSGTTLTIPANATSGSTTFTVINDAVAESTETATLTISSPSAGIVLGSPTTQSISITDNDTAGVTVTPTTVSVTEGGATAGYTVVLNTQPTANVTVTITPDSQVSVNTMVLTFTPANYNIPQTVTVTAVNDTTVEGNHTGTITQSAASSDANYNSVAVASVTANITDNDFIPTVSLSVNPSTGTEAGQTVVTVTATATSAVQGNQTVSLAVSGTNITAGDYTLSGMTITILSGQTTGSATFTIVDDAAVEGTETATLTISSPSAGITLGSPTMQNVTITDNDTETTPPTITYTAFGNTGSTANPVLTVTVTDNVAVPTSGSLVPRIYYRKNTGVYFSTACILASGTGQSGSWNCTVDYALVGGAASGDSITYFVVAQDTSGNIASNPAGATGTDVNNLTAAPPSPNLYDIGTNSTVPTGTYTFLNIGSATLAGNVTVVNNLTLNGIVNNGGFTITLGEDATVTRTSGYVIGSVKKVFGPILGRGGMISFVYNVGTANGYSPVTAIVTSVLPGSALTVTAKQGTQPNLPSATTLRRYWTLTENGSLTANLQFNYLPNVPSETPGVEANYQVIRVAGGIPAFYLGGTLAVDETNDLFVANGVSDFSDWTAGESITLAPTAATATLNGRVTDSLGRGLENVTLTLTGGVLTEPISINTDISGRYRMPEVAAGETYILTVNSKRYRFSQPTRVISITESLTAVNFVADGN